MSSASTSAGGHETTRGNAQRAQQRQAPPSSKDLISSRQEEVSGHLDSHGHSVPAWTGVGIVTLGALVASVAMLFPVVWLVITGLALMAVGGPVGWLMSKRAKTRDPEPGEKHLVR